MWVEVLKIQDVIYKEWQRKRVNGALAKTFFLINAAITNI